MATPKPDARPAAGTENEGFEQSLERLETIVEELEGGELTLEQSLGRYEEGIKLSRRLSGALDAAEQRIERLVEGANGEPATEPMQLEPRAEAPAAPAARRGPAPHPMPPDDSAEGRLPF
jgi:exodeoxyribonuclease VII small subunit